VFGARVRFVFLWLSQVARVLADWGLRITAFLELRKLGGRDQDSAWYAATAVYIAPFVLLAPFHGCLSNSLPRRWVLVAAGLFCLVAVLAFVPTGPWYVSLGIMALGSALYSATRYAMLPAVAQDIRLSLTGVNGWIEMGFYSAMVGGIIVGLAMTQEVVEQMPAAVVVVIVLGAFAVLAALPCSFPSDVPRLESPLRAVAGFFRDCKRVFANREARNSLLAQSVFQGIVVAGSGASFTQVLNLNNDNAGHEAAMVSMVALCVGLALGCGLAACQSSTQRSIGLVPLGLTGLVIAQVWTALTNEAGVAPVGPSLMLGFMGGLITVPLRAVYQAVVPADARGNAMSVMNTVIYVLTTVVAVLMFLLVQSGFLAGTQSQLWFLTVVVAAGAAMAWWVLFPETLEVIVEWVMIPLYRIRVHGPGANKIPPRGPLLLVANHSAYLDPFWIAKIVPRHVRPMMTARFYDLPVIRWLMVNVVRAIRVPEPSFRRETPELDAATKALRNGECVLVFPEGAMRRTQDRYLRQFGQGVWHILREIPDTPVVVFWIEGGWGSWTSYMNGPPLTNKKRDFWRRIDIAVEEPRVLLPEVLADHRSTRRYLMRACLEARRHLGLPVPAADFDESSDPSASASADVQESGDSHS
jgi:1-acyl-sn-glycerol-3-phosphate acyltransferase